MEHPFIVGAGVSLGLQLLKAGPLKDAGDGTQRAVLGLACLGGALAYGWATGHVTPATLASLEGSAEVVYTAASVAVGAIVTWVGFFREGRPHEPPSKDT